MNPRIVAAIKAAHGFGYVSLWLWLPFFLSFSFHWYLKSCRQRGCFRCDLRIVSDANKFYIETILKHHGLLGLFSEIYTNPTSVDELGRIRIFPFHDFTIAPHGCSLCPSNMCKVCQKNHMFLWTNYCNWFLDWLWGMNLSLRKHIFIWQVVRICSFNPTCCHLLLAPHHGYEILKSWHYGYMNFLFSCFGSLIDFCHKRN